MVRRRARGGLGCVARLYRWFGIPDAPVGGWAHLMTAVLAVALGALGYFGSDRPGPPAAQNEITIGMLLLLLAIGADRGQPAAASLAPLS